jgi:hypothetical protein
MFEAKPATDEISTRYAVPAGFDAPLHVTVSELTPTTVQVLAAVDDERRAGDRGRLGDEEAHGARDVLGGGAALKRRHAVRGGELGRAHLVGHGRASHACTSYSPSTVRSHAGTIPLFAFCSAA